MLILNWPDEFAQRLQAKWQDTLQHYVWEALSWKPIVMRS